MTHFYLIRHAERDTPPDFLPGRAPGIHLTERGRRQAERIAARFESTRVDRVFSSPLERAMETAAPLAGRQHLPVGIAEGFTEMDFGRWTGKRVPELAADETWVRFNQFRSGTRIPGGETALEVQHRFVAELLRLRALHPGQSIACVSHADPIRLGLVYFLGMPLDHFDRLEIAPASVTELGLAEWGVRLLGLNEVPE